MKVYVVYAQRYSGGKFGGIGPNVETIGTYSTEVGASKKLAEIKEKFLANGPGFIAEDFEDDFQGSHRVGFAYGHQMGSMSFEPGCYFYKEHEVID
jgi:hypothetical protein